MKAVNETNAKKCDYCVVYAVYTLKEEGLYTYLCKVCYKDVDKAKESINE